ncbi:MAG TPA: hypothetical protein VJ572_09600 [Azonexus sp.]|nr:hypothetical protein [Azonexus sp.]
MKKASADDSASRANRGEGVQIGEFSAQFVGFHDIADGCELRHWPRTALFAWGYLKI